MQTLGDLYELLRQLGEDTEGWHPAGSHLSALPHQCTRQIVTEIDCCPLGYYDHFECVFLQALLKRKKNLLAPAEAGENTINPLICEILHHLYVTNIKLYRLLFSPKWIHGGSEAAENAVDEVDDALSVLFDQGTFRLQLYFMRPDWNERRINWKKNFNAPWRTSIDNVDDLQRTLDAAKDLHAALDKYLLELGIEEGETDKEDRETDKEDGQTDKTPTISSLPQMGSLEELITDLTQLPVAWILQTLDRRYSPRISLRARRVSRFISFGWKKMTTVIPKEG